jgi:hypothetical protein
MKQQKTLVGLATMGTEGAVCAQSSVQIHGGRRAGTRQRRTACSSGWCSCAVRGSPARLHVRDAVADAIRRLERHSPRHGDRLCPSLVIFEQTIRNAVSQ